MLYECRNITLDLARIVAVYAAEQRPLMARDGQSFGILCSGFKHNIWITAPDKTPAEAMRLQTDREALIANWRRFKTTPARNGDVIFSLGEIDLLLPAISGISSVAPRNVGLGGTVSAPTDHCYDIFLMGMDGPITRYVERSGHKTCDSLAAERESLLAAWAAVHHKGAA